MQSERGIVGVYTDRSLLLWALEKMTEHEFRYESMPQKGNPDELQAASIAELPLAIIVDCQAGVFDLIRRLSTSFPRVPIVVWQRSKANEPLLNALDWGAVGVLDDNSPPADVLACLKSVVKGNGWVPASVAQAASRSRRCHLSRREEQLLRLVLHGLRNKEIAYALKISEGTVKVYFSRLFQKLGVSDRYELALLGLRHCGPDSMLPGKSIDHSGEDDPLNWLYVHKSAVAAPTSWAAPSNIPRM